MLNDRSRVTLFWFTIGMIVLVVIVAVITLIRACGGPGLTKPPLTIGPTEVSLCPGESQPFTVEGDVELNWEATGGTISPGGLFTAGNSQGDYAVTAAERDTRRIAKAIVHVVACTPMPSPTSLPSPTPTTTPAPTVTPTQEPTLTPLTADPQGDVGAYDSGAPVEGLPAGIDIRAASIRPNLRIVLQPTTGMPEELAAWTNEGEVVLWLSLYQPIPDPPPYSDWLFALDVDGETETGRPAGSARINPDLGDDAVVGVLYDPASAEYAPYFLVWDPAQEGWADGPEEVRYYLSESRTLVALALPLGTLTQTVEQTTGATLTPEAVRGRAAAFSFAGEEAVVDFYPDRPE